MLLIFDLHLGGCVNQKGLWSNIKTLLSFKGQQSIPHEGHVVTSDRDKGEIFNHYFTEQCHLKLPQGSHLFHLLVRRL